MEGDSSGNDQLSELHRKVDELEREKNVYKTLLKLSRKENIDLHLALQSQDGLGNSSNGVGLQKRYKHDQDDSQSTESARVKEELNEPSVHVAELSRKCSAFEQENSRLKEQLDEANVAAEEYIELRQTNAGLESELVRVKQSVEYGSSQEIQAQLTESKREVGNLKQELGGANGRMKVIVNYVSELCEKLGLSYRKNRQSKDESATQTRRFNEVLNALDPSTALRNKLVKDLNKQGVEKRRNGQYEQGMELYFKALAIEESGRKSTRWLGRLWNNISLCWRNMANYEKALDAVEKAIAYDATNAIHFYNRGFAHKGLGNKADAIADFKKALELKPNYQKAVAELAKLEAEQLP